MICNLGWRGRRSISERSKQVTKACASLNHRTLLLKSSIYSGYFSSDQNSVPEVSLRISGVEEPKKKWNIKRKRGRGGEADKKRQVVVKEMGVMGQRQWLEKGPKIDRRMEGVLIIHTIEKDRDACYSYPIIRWCMLLSFLITILKHIYLQKECCHLNVEVICSTIIISNLMIDCLQLI